MTDEERRQYHEDGRAACEKRVAADPTYLIVNRYGEEELHPSFYMIIGRKLFFTSELLAGRDPDASPHYAREQAEFENSPSASRYGVPERLAHYEHFARGWIEREGELHENICNDMTSEKPGYSPKPETTIARRTPRLGWGLISLILAAAVLMIAVAK